jgi:phosphoribosyl-ATP pyrophosphohydrolase
MLLSELKLFEYGMSPIADIVSKVGKDLSAFKKDKVAVEKPKDVNPSLRPLLKEYVLTTSPPVGTATEIQKIFKTPEQIKVAVDGMVGIIGTISQMKKEFADGVKELHPVLAIAKKASNKSKYVAKLLKDAEAASKLKGGEMVEKRMPAVTKAISAYGAGILDALMKVATSETWVEKRISNISNMDVNNTELVWQSIEEFYVLMATLAKNAITISSVIESLRKPEEEED